MDGDITCVFGQRSGLPVTSVFENLTQSDSTELKGKIDLDGCISNSVDVEQAKQLCRDDPECDLMSLSNPSNIDGSVLAERVCFYKVPDGSMIDQDRNFYGDGKSLFMDCSSVTQAFVDSIGATGNIPDIQKNRTKKNIENYIDSQLPNFELDPTEWRPLEEKARELSACEVTLGESRCDKNVYEPQHKSEGVFMCDEIQRVNGVDRSVGLKSRILDVTREQCYDACDKDDSCSGIAFWRTGYRSRMKTRQFYADMLNPAVQLQSTDTCDFLLPGIGDDPAVCLDKKPKNTEVRQVTVDSKGLVCEYTTKDYHKIHLERALKQAGMQSACGFQKVDNVIDGVQGRVDRFKMSGCAMIVGKVFNRGTRVGCEGGQIMSQRIVEDAVTSQFARWRFVGEGFCRNEDGDQIVLRDTTSRNNFEIVEKGKGYTIGDRLILSRGKDEKGNDLPGEDAIVVVTSVDVEGAIMDFDVEEKGMGYSKEKTYAAVGGSGTMSPMFKVSSMALPLCQKECGADSRCAALSFDEYMTYSLKQPTWNRGICSADDNKSKEECEAKGFVSNQRIFLNTGNDACGEVNEAKIQSKNLDDGRDLTIDEKKDRCDLTAGCVFEENVCKPANVPFRVFSTDEDGQITSVVPEDAAEALNSLKAGLSYDVRKEDGTKTLARVKTNENISCVLYGGEKRYTDVDDGGESFTAYQFTPYGPGVCEGADDPQSSLIAKKDGVGVFKMNRGDELLCLQRCQTTPGCNAVNYTESADPKVKETYCTTLGKCSLKNMRTANRTFSTMTGNTIEQKGDDLIVKGPGVAMEFPFVEAIDPRTCRGYGSRANLPCTSKNDFLKFYSIRVPNCLEKELDWTPFLGISVRPSATEACKTGFSRYMSALTLNPATQKLQGTVCMTHDKWSAAENEAACATICREDPSCAYFSYYPLLGCQTYTEDECTFLKQEFESGSSKGARSRKKVFVEKDDSGITASGERVCWAKELESKLEESMLITPEWRGDDRVRNSTCVLLGERNVCRRVQTIEDTNQCPAPGRPCWIGYPAGCAKILDDGSCPIVDIPAEYRGQIMRSRVAVDPENGESLCAETVESRTQCTNSCSTDPEAFCSYETTELDPFALISPTEGIPVEGAMLTDMEALMHHRGGALNPLETCEDPLKAGKVKSCMRDFDHSRMGPMRHGFTLNDISDSVKVVGFDIGQPSDCGAATTEDDCAMQGGSCRWNAGTCESTVRRDVAPTNVRCSYRLDDHTFLFETDPPKIKGNEGTTLALPTSGVFDVVLQSHNPTNIGNAVALKSNVQDSSVLKGNRCTKDSQCASGRCDTTGDFSCFGRCVDEKASTTQTRMQNCGVVDAPQNVEEMECVDRLRVIANTIRPERHLEGYSLYPHQRPKKQPVGALCGTDAHCESGVCDVDDIYGCGGKRDGQGPRCVKKGASGKSQQENCPYAVGNPCSSDKECESRVCADTGECHGHCVALPTSASEYTTMARKKEEEGVTNFPQSEWTGSSYRTELRDMTIRHSICPGTFRPLTSADMNEVANLDVFGCETFTAKATDAAIRCGDSRPRDEKRCALYSTEDDCPDSCIWKDDVCKEDPRIRTCNAFMRYENRHTNGNGGRTCYYRHTSPQMKASVSIEPWKESDGASGDMHVQQITQPATRGAFSFENPTRPHEFDPKEMVPVNTKCDAKRIEFKDMLKEKASESPFATFSEPKEDIKDVCGLPEGGNSCGNEGCCPSDQYAADDVFCTLLEGDRAGTICRMSENVPIPENKRSQWIMLVKRLCRITRRTWGVKEGGDNYKVGDIIYTPDNKIKFEVTEVVDTCSSKTKSKCKSPCVFDMDDWMCQTPGNQSIGSVSKIRLISGSDFPPQPFMETKTRGSGSDCVLSANLLFKEGEAAVRALDATFIPNDTNMLTAGTEPDASGQYRLLDYNNFSKLLPDTRINFVRACVDIAAPVCQQPVVDLSTGGWEGEQEEKKKSNKLTGTVIAALIVALVGLGGLVYGRTKGKVASRSIMGYVVLCAVVSFFYTTI